LAYRAVVLVAIFNSPAADNNFDRIMHGRIEMAKRIFYRAPSLITLVAIGILTIIEFVFLTQTVFAQGASPTPEGYDYLKIISLVILVFNGVGFLAAFVWYIVRGKSTDQLTKNNQDLASSNSELRAQKAELKTEVSELKALLEAEERETERLRKLNLRLQGDSER
jgi:type VI protein secretion system component VasK